MTRDPDTDLLVVNGMFTVSIVLARCHDHGVGRIPLDGAPRHGARSRPDDRRPDGRPERGAARLLRLPSLDVHGVRLRIREDNGIFLDGYRYESLDYFFGMAQTVRARVAA